jgi:hypothetical protein
MRLNPLVVRYARIALLALVVLYGALLRLDAISAKFDPVAAPRWLHRLEASRAGASGFRPHDMRWDAYPRFEHKDGPPSQYRSDPYTYLQYAREMTSFYAAHRREPLFPFVTRIWLWLLHGDDSAVSFASGAFSVLAIVLTFAVGRAAFSSTVGLAAAALWAIEFDAITWGTEGWRDDAFTCAVLLTALLMLRMARQPTVRSALMLGAAAGAACLIRITSLSFIVAGLAWLAMTSAAPARERLRTPAIAAAVMLLLVGPFLVNCWRTFGDPLYAINVHAGVYKATETEASGGDLSVREYIAAHLRSRPFQTIETFALGLTQYPFARKWAGFDVWHPRLGSILAAAAVLGLFLFTATAAGRLLLVVLIASLLPYALTWRLIADWRFTEHAYPIFLIAACSPIWFAVRAWDGGGALWRDRVQTRRGLAIYGTVAAAGLVVWLILTRLTPGLVFQETVGTMEPATIMAGERDASFFGRDWPTVVRTGTVTTRVATGARATIAVPLLAGVDYDVMLRVDPSTQPMQPGVAPARIQMLLNGRLIGACDPQSTPDRVGICRMVFPADGVRPGVNRLTLVLEQPSGFRVWYLRARRMSG